MGLIIAFSGTKSPNIRIMRLPAVALWQCGACGAGPVPFVATELANFDQAQKWYRLLIDTIFWRLSMSKTAKLFWNGRSQAVRLPKEFRMEGTEVRISRKGDSVILEPIAIDEVTAAKDDDGWGFLDEIAKRGGLSDEDAAAFEAAINEDPGEQLRPELDELFREEE